MWSMVHIGILLTVVVFSLGLVAVGQTVLLSRIHDLEELKLYKLFLIVFNLGLIYEFFRLYLLFVLQVTQQIPVEIIFSILRTIHSTLFAILIYTSFSLVFFLVNKSLSKKTAMIYTVINSLLICGLIVSNFFPQPQPSFRFAYQVYYGFNALQYTALVLAFLVLLSRLRSVSPLRKKQVLQIFGIVHLSIFLVFLMLRILNYVFSLDVLYYFIFFSLAALLFNVLPILYLRPALGALHSISLQSDFKMGKEDFFKRFGITEREIDVICLIDQGKSNQEIEKKLFISLHTVKSHINRIFRKTGVRNRIELVNLIKSSTKPDEVPYP